MFGTREERLARMRRLAELIRQQSGHVTQAEAARQLGVGRSTVHKDLALIQEYLGVLFWEDECGRLGWFGGASDAQH